MMNEIITCNARVKGKFIIQPQSVAQSIVVPQGIDIAVKIPYTVNKVTITHSVAISYTKNHLRSAKLQYYSASSITSGKADVHKTPLRVGGGSGTYKC
jgi:hypothetical protein